MLLEVWALWVLVVSAFGSYAVSHLCVECDAPMAEAAAYRTHAIVYGHCGDPSL